MQEVPAGPAQGTEGGAQRDTGQGSGEGVQARQKGVVSCGDACSIRGHHRVVTAMSTVSGRRCGHRPTMASATPREPATMPAVHRSRRASRRPRTPLGMCRMSLPAGARPDISDGTRRGLAGNPTPRPPVHIGGRERAAGQTSSQPTGRRLTGIRTRSATENLSDSQLPCSSIHLGQQSRTRDPKAPIGTAPDGNVRRS